MFGMFSMGSNMCQCRLNGLKRSSKIVLFTHASLTNSDAFYLAIIVGTENACRANKSV